MRRLNKLTAAAAVTALVFAGAGCSKKSSDEGAAGDDCVEKGDTKVGMAFDVGGRGDQSFNDSAARGMDKAACELGFEVKDAEAQKDEPESAREERLQQFVDAGYNPVVAVGFVYENSVTKIAKANPDVDFAIVDSRLYEDDNVANLVFAEEQGSFLAGAAAAFKTETGKVGFVGGVDTELIKKFEAGYRAGVKAAKPDVTVQSVYLSTGQDFSGFDDPAKAVVAATGMYEKDIDIVFHAAGGSGSGIFEAATAAKKWAIGVDSDQAKTADESLRGSILTSMLKNVDVAVYDFLKSVDEGEAKTGVQSYDLKVGGIDYSTTGGHVDDIKDDLEKFKEQIVDGTIEVPTTVTK